MNKTYFRVCHKDTLQGKENNPNKFGNVNLVYYLCV